MATKKVSAKKKAVIRKAMFAKMDSEGALYCKSKKTGKRSKRAKC